MNDDILLSIDYILIVFVKVFDFKSTSFLSKSDIYNSDSFKVSGTLTWDSSSFSC